MSSFSLTRSQAAVVARILRLGGLHYSGRTKLLPIRPRLWPLMIGPTGSGKSFLARRVADALNAKYLRISFGDWVVQGARGMPTLFGVVYATTICERLVVHLDELDKLPVGNVDEWSRAVANEIWGFLDGELPVSRFLRDPERRQLVTEIQRKNLEEGSAVRKIFLVGSGTWQSSYDEAMSPKMTMGFGQATLSTPSKASTHMVDALEALRGPGSELIARFDSAILCLQPPDVAEAYDMLVAIGCASYAEGAGLNVRSLLAQRLPRQGFRALESCVTDALLAGWAPDKAPQEHQQLLFG